MSGFSTNIEKDTLAGTNFREVLFTTDRTQLVLMCLQAGEDIGMEKHDENDQFIRIEQGTGYAEIDGHRHDLEDGVAVVVPAGTTHNIVNTSDSEMKLYTLYAPPHHPDGTIHKTKEDAHSQED